MAIVRVKRTVDDEILNLSTEYDMKKVIRKVIEDQNEIMPAELYHREWETIEEGIKYEDTENSFSVKQFNVLAQGLSSGPDVPTPFNPKESYNNAYGGFTDVSRPEIVLNFESRRWRLLEAILAKSPDILGLQEIDRFYDFFEPLLSKIGYKGIFKAKPDSPSLKFGWYSDGCALFWKTDVFECITSESSVFDESNQIYIIAQLRHISSRKELEIAVTHLKAKSGKKNEEIRKLQVAQLLKALQDSSKNKRKPSLILGDFNTGPNSESILKLQKELNVLSACQHEYTTYKIRVLRYQSRHQIISFTIIYYVVHIA